MATKREEITGWIFHMSPEEKSDLVLGEVDWLIAPDNPGPGCLAKAGVDEPLFILRAQDALAPGIVEEWARLLQSALGSRGLDGYGNNKVVDALMVANEMRVWQVDHGFKIPD